MIYLDDFLDTKVTKRGTDVGRGVYGTSLMHCVSNV